MGQKTKPLGFRLGVNRTWDSRWFGTKLYADQLHQDLKLRKYLFDRLKAAAVSKVIIERPAGKTRVSIYAGRPGLVIGKKGQDIETLRKNLEKQVANSVTPSNSNIILPGLTLQTQNSGVPLPLPILTSAGFFETGTSGKILIHNLPALFNIISFTQNTFKSFDLTFSINNIHRLNFN